MRAGAVRDDRPESEGTAVTDSVTATTQAFAHIRLYGDRFACPCCSRLADDLQLVEDDRLLCIGCWTQEMEGLEPWGGQR